VVASQALVAAVAMLGFPRSSGAGVIEFRADAVHDG